VPLTPIKINDINTIDILSVAGAFEYVFEIPENGQAQVLWAQYNLVTDATAGARTPFLQIQDETATPVLTLVYFLTVAPSGSAIITWSQGNEVVPGTVLGQQIGLPNNGVFVQNGWRLRLAQIFTNAGDVLTGFFQTRGLHNSSAPR